jgi:Fe-S-cluster containining protein
VSGTGKRLALARGVKFTCKQCADCCRNFPVSLTPAEAERYDSRDWTDVLGVPGPAYTTQRGLGGKRVHYLRRAKDGACVFLGEDSLCGIHGRYGEEDKPLVCRVFPFTYVPGSESVRPTVGAFFTCTSVAAGDGEAIAAKRKGLELQLAEIEAVQPLVPHPDAVPILGRMHYPRIEIEYLLELILAEIENIDLPFPERLLVVSRFVDLVFDSNLDSLSQGTARKQVAAFAAGSRSQVSRKLILVPPARPPLPQRLLFRLILGFAARRDPIDVLSWGVFRRTIHRFGNLLAGLTYLAGTGALHPLGRTQRVAIGEVRRQAPSADPRVPIADGALTRYFVGQLSGKAIFNPQFELRLLLPSLGRLFRQYPIVLLFARAACLARGGDALTSDDYASALRTADRNFGRIGWDRGLVGGMRGRLLSDLTAALTLVPWCAQRPGERVRALPEPSP